MANSTRDPISADELRSGIEAAILDGDRLSAVETALTAVRDGGAEEFLDTRELGVPRSPQEG